MNALGQLRTLLHPPPNQPFHDLLTIISQDDHVQKTGLYPWVTSSSLYRLIDAMKQGVDFAHEIWGFRTTPYDLVFACDATDSAGAISFNRMFVGESLPAREPVLYVTNVFVVRAMKHAHCGDLVRFGHMPDYVPDLPAFHVMALQTIEECLHAKQYRFGMRPLQGSTLEHRDDPMEQEVSDLMPDIIREFRFKEAMDLRYP